VEHKRNWGEVCSEVREEAPPSKLTKVVLKERYAEQREFTDKASMDNEEKKGSRSTTYLQARCQKHLGKMPKIS